MPKTKVSLEYADLEAYLGAERIKSMGKTEYEYLSKPYREFWDYLFVPKGTETFHTPEGLYFEAPVRTSTRPIPVMPWSGPRIAKVEVDGIVYEARIENIECPTVFGDLARVVLGVFCESGSGMLPKSTSLQVSQDPVNGGRF